MEEIKSNKPEKIAQDNASLKIIGNFIKEARLSRNQSTEELASNLKMGEHQLKALEDGKYEMLPEKVFVKAMVRRISEKLKLDTDFIMSEFDNERKEMKIEEIVEEVANKTTDRKKKPNSIGFSLFILISIILGLLASTFIFNLFSESFQEKLPTIDTLKND